MDNRPSQPPRFAVEILSGLTEQAYILGDFAEEFEQVLVENGRFLHAAHFCLSAGRKFANIWFSWLASLYFTAEAAERAEDKRKTPRPLRPPR